MKCIWQLLCLGILAGCNVNSPERLAKQSEEVQKKLLACFTQIESLEDIVKQGPAIREGSFALVELIQRVDAQGLHLQGDTLSCVSEELQHEMQRVYQIEGARSLVEKYQREPFIALDGYCGQKKKG